jgi:hypothetical protein
MLLGGFPLLKRTDCCCVDFLCSRGQILLGGFSLLKAAMLLGGFTMFSGTECC